MRSARMALRGRSAAAAEAAGGRGAGGRHEDRVVAGHRADHLVEVGLIQGASERVRASGGSANHDQRGRRLHGEDGFCHEPIQCLVAQLSGDEHRPAGRHVAGRGLGQAKRPRSRESVGWATAIPRRRSRRWISSCERTAPSRTTRRISCRRRRPPPLPENEYSS